MNGVGINGLSFRAETNVAKKTEENQVQKTAVQSSEFKVPTNTDKFIKNDEQKKKVLLVSVVVGTVVAGVLAVKFHKSIVGFFSKKSGGAKESQVQPIQNVTVDKALVEKINAAKAKLDEINGFTPLKAQRQRVLACLYFKAGDVGSGVRVLSSSIAECCKKKDHIGVLQGCLVQGKGLQKTAQGVAQLEFAKSVYHQALKYIEKVDAAEIEHLKTNEKAYKNFSVHKIKEHISNQLKVIEEKRPEIQQKEAEFKKVNSFDNVKVFYEAWLEKLKKTSFNDIVAK